MCAIAPVSVIDSTATTLYPGGILNTGFAVAWAEQRQQNAEPAGPGHGQPWAYQRVQEGVGRRVIALTRRTEQPDHRRDQHDRALLPGPASVSE